MTVVAGAQGHAPKVLIQSILPVLEDGYEGHAPSVMIKPIARPSVNPLIEVYRRVWDHPAYRVSSPGEELAQQFLKEAAPKNDAEIICFGVGSGREAFMLALFGNLRVTMIDFAENCLDPEVRGALKTQADRLKFRLADLTRSIPVTAPYGYCVDVLEHIPEEDVPAALWNILHAAHHVFFAISTVPDNLGAVIGEALHVTVKTKDWWLAALAKAGATVMWSQDQKNRFCVYVSSWKDADEVIKGGTLNTTDEVVVAQTLANIKAGWQHVHPYDRQDREVILLAGGPSTCDFVDKIKELRAAGAALVTMNGSYNWALEHGLKPSMQIVVDAREFNSRFTKPVIDECLYMMASQVHPSTLEGLPRDRTFLWHCGIGDDAEMVVRQDTGAFYPVPGGSTVALRSIPLLRMLGFWKLHIFGMDSCVWRTSASHHAYPQPENDNEALFPVSVGGRQFFCAPWMVSQASEFRGLVKFIGDEVELELYGDGLIAYMIQTGADFADIHEELA